MLHLVKQTKYFLTMIIIGKICCRLPLWYWYAHYDPKQFIL